MAVIFVSICVLRQCHSLPMLAVVIFTLSLNMCLSFCPSVFLPINRVTQKVVNRFDEFLCRGGMCE